MFRNKYQNISSLELLKATKPKRRTILQGLNRTVFDTKNKDLKLMADFGGEMFKFLPDWEQLAYKGEIYGDEVGVAHGKDDDRTTTYFSQDFMDAFDQFGIEDENGNGSLEDELNDYHLYTVERDDPENVESLIVGEKRYVIDLNGDGRITNSETISWAENEGINSYGERRGRVEYNEVDDGLEDWRPVSWVAGQHHRTGDPFDSSAMFAGANIGQAFQNFDFDGVAGNFNHVRQVKGSGYDTSAIENRAYDPDVRASLRALDIEWDDVTSFLRESFGEKSYYEIVMYRDYTDLSPVESFMLTAAMKESSYRIFQCMSQVIGPLNLTRNDAEMIEWFDSESVISQVNPYLDCHNLALFQAFFSMQHSFVNQFSSFVEPYQNGSGEEVGYNAAVLDRERFWDFSKEMGTERYQGVDRDDDDEVTTGKLYAYHDQVLAAPGEEAAARADAVELLINSWLGSFEAEDVPRWEGYADDREWVDVRDDEIVYWGLYDGEWDWREVAQIRKPVAEDPDAGNHNYSWDRKWSWDDISIRYEYERDTVEEQDRVSRYGGPRVWARFNNVIYGNQSILSDGSITAEGHHPNYAVTQVSGLSYNQMVSAYVDPGYSDNWVVHAYREFMRNGQAKSYQRVAERRSMQRRAKAEFKYDQECYEERMAELHYEKVLDARIAAKRSAKRKAEANKALQRSQSQHKRWFRQWLKMLNNPSSGWQSNYKSNYKSNWVVRQQAKAASKKKPQKKKS